MDRRTSAGMVLVIAGLCGCAGSGSGPLAGPRAPATPETVAVSEPTTASPAEGAPRSGWPSAAGGTAEVTPARTRVDPAPPPAGGCVRPEPTRTGAAQRDLQLRLEGPARITASEHPQLSATLRNVSKSRGHHVVLPSDGSESGWRDPVISFTAFIDEGDGCWRELVRAPIMRCGLFDHFWLDDVVALAAGKSRSIDPLWGFPSFEWRKGTVRLFLHYSWTGGAASRDGTSSVDPAENLGKMRREAPYELVSNPVEMVVSG